jgi:hypothetical protein
MRLSVRHGNEVQFSEDRTWIQIALADLSNKDVLPQIVSCMSQVQGDCQPSTSYGLVMSINMRLKQEVVYLEGGEAPNSVDLVVEPSFTHNSSSMKGPEKP